jgi:hypothetical protein
MHIAKLRVRDETGLVPAGRYFGQLAKNLRTANTREVTRRANGDAQDRALEALLSTSFGRAVGRAV